MNIQNISKKVELFFAQEKNQCLVGMIAGAIITALAAMLLVMAIQYAHKFDLSQLSLRAQKGLAAMIALPTTIAALGVIGTGCAGYQLFQKRKVVNE